MDTKKLFNLGNQVVKLRQEMHNYSSCVQISCQTQIKFFNGILDLIDEVRMASYQQVDENKEKSTIRRFKIYASDPLGISEKKLLCGEGVVFENGKICLNWIDDSACILIMDSVEKYVEFLKKYHRNIVWID